jgi:hypothetical protein
MELENIIKKHLKLIGEQSIEDKFAHYKTNKLQIRRILESGGPIQSNSITKKFIPKPSQKSPNELLSLQTDSFIVVTNKNQPNNLNAMPKSEQQAIQIVKSYPGIESIPEEQQYVWVEQPLKGIFKAHIIYPLNLSNLNESNYETDNYMFFSNLKQIHRQCEMLLKMNSQMIDEVLTNGHDWAADHITEAKTNMDQVFDFLINTSKESLNEGLMEAKEKNKLCSRGVSAAKSKYKVYPSAYANGYAVQVCKGKIKGLDGMKKCSGSYCGKKKK